MLSDFFEPVWDFLFDKMGVFGMVIATATPVIALVVLFLIIAAIVGIFSAVKEKRLKKMYNKALYLEYRGRYPEAWKLFKKYAKKAKPSAEAYYHIGKFCEAALDNDYDWAYSKKDMKPSYWFRKAKALGSENSECELLKARFLKSFPSDLLESAKILKEVKELCIKKVPGAGEVMDKIILEISEKLKTGVISGLESRALLEDKHAQFLLAKEILEKENSRKGDEKFFGWILFSAECGNAHAQLAVAELYRRGGFDGVVQKNPRKAIEFYKQAAENGLAKAKVSLGEMYYVGEGCEKDLLEAAKWFAKAADEDNNASAAHNAVICYYEQAAQYSSAERHAYNIEHHRVEEGKQEAAEYLKCLKLAQKYNERAEELGYKAK